ncbi:MAG: hypothetical protein ABIP03_10005 [Aquihabitans sp.]
MNRRRSALVGLGLACLVAVSASPAFAYEAEGGTKTCPSNQTGKTQAKYNDTAAITGPGSSTTGYYTPNDGLWHVQQRWGVDGGGRWDALGDPSLNLTDTFAFCVTQ